jgi:ribosomal protein L37AE/L43A
MIIKHKDNNQASIDYLSDLLERDIADDRKCLIQRELQSLYCGDSGEQAAAYQLDVALKDSENWLLIHDLRIEHDGDEARIDSLLLGRMLDIYVIESRNFSGDVTVSDMGDFSCSYQGNFYSVTSPIAQNLHHITLLDKFLRDKQLLPKRLGLVLQPHFHSIVLMSNESHLTKPKKGHFDCSAVMTVERFLGRFKYELDKKDETTDITSMAKVISTDSLKRFAEKLVLNHKPCAIDYAASFGLRVAAEDVDVLADVVPDCPVCGRAMVRREARKGKNAGKGFWGCVQFPKCRGVVHLDDENALVAISGDSVSAPCCPRCGAVMVRRVTKKGEASGREFWGCGNFPECRATVSIS